MYKAHKGPPDQSHAQLQQQAVGAPIESMVVGIMGPLPCTDKRNRWVLATMDYFTKWLATVQDPPHAHQPCSCWGENCRPQQK